MAGEVERVKNLSDEEAGKLLLETFSRSSETLQLIQHCVEEISQGETGFIVEMFKQLTNIYSDGPGEIAKDIEILRVAAEALKEGASLK